MFVRGEIEDPDNILVDIGTGYFVEKVYFCDSAFCMCNKFNFTIFVV